MTIGDIFVGYRDTLEKIREKHEVFILGVSEKDCEECCKGEIILHQIMRLFEVGDIQYEGQKIPIVRLDVEKFHKQLQSEGISLDGIPRIYLYLKGSYYLYDEGDNLNLFLLFVNRVLYPVANLDTDLQVKNFINTDMEYIESTPFYKTKFRAIGDLFKKMQKVVRVAVFVTDRDKHKSKIDEVEKVARALAERTTFRFGVVTSSELVKTYKKELGAKYFNETSNSSVIIFRSGVAPDAQQRFYDIESDVYDLQEFINFSSLEDVEKLTLTSMNIMKDLKMPIFLTLLLKDFEKNKEASELMTNLRELSKEYPQLLFAYLDDEENHILRQQMAIIWPELPSIGLLNNEGMEPVNFPRNQKFSVANLRAFFDSFLNGTVSSYAFTLPELNTDYSKNMPHAKKIDLVSTLS